MASNILSAIGSMLVGGGVEGEAAAAAAAASSSSSTIFHEGIRIFREALPMLQGFIDAIYTEEQKELLKRELLNALPELILASIGLGVGLYLLWNDEENLGVLFGKNKSDKKEEGEGGGEGGGGGGGGIGEEGEEEVMSTTLAIGDEARAIILLLLYIILIAASAGVLTYKLYIIFTKVNNQLNVG